MGGGRWYGEVVWEVVGGMGKWYVVRGTWYVVRGSGKW